LLFFTVSFSPPVVWSPISCVCFAFAFICCCFHLANKDVHIKIFKCSSLDEDLYNWNCVTSPGNSQCERRRRVGVNWRLTDDNWAGPSEPACLEIIDLLNALHRPICLHDCRQHGRSLGRVDIKLDSSWQLYLTTRTRPPISRSVNNPASPAVATTAVAFAVSGGSRGAGGQGNCPQTHERKFIPIASLRDLRQLWFLSSRWRYNYVYWPLRISCSLHGSRT